MDTTVERSPMWTRNCNDPRVEVIVELYLAPHGLVAGFLGRGCQCHATDKAKRFLSISHSYSRVRADAGRTRGGRCVASAGI
jgi:hypothetical protein